ncbi:hypothetical protein [Paraburkholderia sp. RL17-368-BIF-A]|uniref:hypothetical protein n=1 Tax=Paraburkholderia sp. RL17-368-BIF-A TaxID=3031628 RepID=UPI002AA54AB9
MQIAETVEIIAHRHAPSFEKCAEIDPFVDQCIKIAAIEWLERRTHAFAGIASLLARVGRPRVSVSPRRASPNSGEGDLLRCARAFQLNSALRRLVTIGAFAAMQTRLVHSGWN